MSEINRLNTEQAALQENIHEVKKNTNEVADSVASLVFQIQAQSQDCNVLRSQIVQSPERIKREIVQKSESLEKEKGVFLKSTMGDADRRKGAPPGETLLVAYLPAFFFLQSQAALTRAQARGGRLPPRSRCLALWKR